MTTFALRFTSISAAALLVGLVAHSGCKKAKEGGPAGSSGAAKAQAGNALSHLPKDSTIVFGISVERGLKAKMVQPFLDKAKADMPDDLKELKEKCGIDVMGGAMRSMTIAMKDPNDQSSSFAAVATTFNKAKANECMTKMGGTAEEKGKVVIYKAKGETKPVYWASENLAILALDENATEASFKPVFEGGLDKNEAIKKLMGETKVGSVIWIVGNIPGDASGMMPGAEQVRFSIDGDADVSLEGALLFTDEEKAKAAKTKADQQVGMSAMVLGEASKNIVVGQTGNAVTFSAKFSEEDVKKITTTVQGMMGGMGGR